MDTISRENTSYLPIAGVAIGVLACALSIGAIVSNNKLSKKVPDGLQQTVEKIDLMESEIRSASSTADTAKSHVANLASQTNTAFQTAAAQIQELRGEVDKLKEASKPKAPAAGAKGAKGPVVAGEGEYVIKPGDSGMKIAKAHGCSLSDLQAVNPGLNWSKLAPGQKIKLPKK